jgi:hypothetical protein
MSQANRLKLKKNRQIQSKKKYKHGEIQRSGSEKRGYKVRYWNQKTGSWQSTKPAPLVRKVIAKKEKPKTRAEKLEEGMATWNTNPGNKAYGAKLEGSKMVKKTDKPKSETETKTEQPKTEDKKTESNNNKLKIKATTTGGPVKSGVEYARSKGDDLAGYRRTKDTRITKKLKKAGFTEDRLARLRKDHADWKAKRKKKKKS